MEQSTYYSYWGKPDKRACPPEDGGGPYGYMNMLEIIKNPKYEGYEEIMEWLGDGFDPERFSVD